SLLRKQPSTGGTMSFYDRLVVPVVRMLERVIGDRPPFGQSVVAVARVKEQGDPAEEARGRRACTLFPQAPFPAPAGSISSPAGTPRPCSPGSRTRTRGP